MKSSSLIVWLLLATCIAIDLAIIGELQIRRNYWPDVGGIVGIGLTFSQVGLLALWAVWGKRGILVRGVSTLLGAWGLACLGTFSATGGLGGSPQWFGLLLVQCGTSLIPFIIARSAGYTLVNHKAEQPSATSGPSSSGQFTIWWMLSLMTAVGITLAVLRFATFPMGELLEIAGFITLLALTVCTVVLLTLCLSKVIIAIIATVVICPIVGILLSFTGLAPGEGAFEMTLMICVQGLASVSTAAVLRTAGFRLIRRNAPSEATASKSTDASARESEGQVDEL